MHNRKKDFLNYLRHLLLIKWHTCKYTVKMLISLAKGNRFEPTFTLSTFITNMENLFENNTLNDFPPLGPYEYREMIKYLKKFHKAIKSMRKSSKSYKLTSFIIKFSRKEVPMEDLLYQAAQDCGFSVVDENIRNSYLYKIKNIF